MFLDGGSSIGTGMLSGGVATLTTSALAAGDHTITTSYAGDPDFVGGTGSLTTNPQVVVAPPSIAASFTPGAVPQNGTSTLTFTITNPAADTVGATGVAFTDTLPAGLVVATPNGLANTCGGTATAVAGSGSVSMSAGTIATGSGCTLSIAVNTSAPGTFVNTSAPVTSTNGGTGTTGSATLHVAAPPSAQIASPADNQDFDGGSGRRDVVLVHRWAVRLQESGSSTHAARRPAPARSTLDAGRPRLHGHRHRPRRADRHGQDPVHGGRTAVATIASPAGGRVYAVGQAVSTSSRASRRRRPGNPDVRRLGRSIGRHRHARHLEPRRARVHGHRDQPRRTNRERQASTYTVAEKGPSTTITSPVNGASYMKGQIVDASYGCQDGASGPGISTCAGPVASGAADRHLERGTGNVHGDRDVRRWADRHENG